MTLDNSHWMFMVNRGDECLKIEIKTFQTDQMVDKLRTLSVTQVPIDLQKQLYLVVILVSSGKRVSFTATGVK